MLFSVCRALGIVSLLLQSAWVCSLTKASELPEPLMSVALCHIRPYLLLIITAPIFRPPGLAN